MTVEQIEAEKKQQYLIKQKEADQRRRIMEEE